MELLGKRKDSLQIIGISILGSIITTWFMCVPCRENLYNYTIVTFFSTLLWVALWIGNDRLTHFLSQRVSWVKFPVRRLVMGVFSTVSYTIAVVIIIIQLWEYFLHQDVGNDWYIVAYSLVITFLISLFMHGREFLLQWRASAIEAERFQKESARAHYESLRNQVNPHFLFNSLNALTGLVYENQDKAAQFIKQLSEVYRYVLDTRDREVVSLEDELHFLDSYLFLQQIRYGNKLKIGISLAGIKTSMPPLVLQMLIENAIKHNIISEEDPLEIKVYAEGAFLVVENTIRKKNVLPDESSGLGLENIRKRYGFLGDGKVVVTDRDGKFKVMLPFLEQPE